MPQLQHGTDNFTSPLKEGMLWTFSPEKFDGFSEVRIPSLLQHVLENGCHLQGVIGALDATQVVSIKCKY
jgi:hypothetical protein